VPTAEFENWWAELQRQPGGLRDTDALETARRIGRALRRLSEPDQAEYLDQLLHVLLQRHHAFGVTLFLLEGINDPAVLHRIAAWLVPLPPPQDADEEAHLADLIRILAAADDDGLVHVVERYLLERPILPAWSTVPWALWPHRKQLFAAAWARFFNDRDPAEWTNTLVIKSFLGEPEAIHVVRQRIEDTGGGNWRALRDALLRQAGIASWLSTEQRRDLERL
jgi:hypothetical protein